MRPELLGGLILSGVGVLTLIAYLNHRLERARLERIRALAAAGMQIQRCWRIIDAVPSPYLPAALRKVLAAVMGHMVDHGLELDANNPFFREHEIRVQRFRETMDRDDPLQLRPSLSPADRKTVTQLLKDTKRLAAEASGRSLISRDELQNSQTLVDALLMRIMVDHLKMNGFNSETIGNYFESLNYLRQARAELTRSDGERYADEIREMDADIARLDHLLQEERDKRARSTEESALTKAWEAEKQRAEQELKKEVYD